ncbi:nitroreductase family protein [Oryzifoliimicrobium ureilyticus]|uniref:nitroreductase family protein n=1 Tax=Oryzifoliimicrobium ureilyticus TaxID=3113724 RepID=UPI0030766550
MTKSNHRESSFPIDSLFLDRWSPRAFRDEAISEEQILSILEAAHWAPSSSNQQPWRFIYALKGTEQWEKALELLIEFNQGWAQNASALVFIVSRTFQGEVDGERKPSYSHSFDAGTAFGFLSIQAHLAGFHTHGMGGIHYDKIKEAYAIPDGYRVEAAVAIGTIGDRDTLPDKLREREVPSSRKPLSEVAFNGTFTAN